MERHPRFMDWKTIWPRWQYSPKLAYRFSTIPFGIPDAFVVFCFADRDKLIPNFMWKCWG